MWLLFPVMFFGEKCNMEVELGAFFVIFMKRSYSSTLSLTDLTKSYFGAVNIQFPARHIAQRSEAGRPLGIIINISCEMS